MGIEGVNIQVMASELLGWVSRAIIYGTVLAIVTGLFLRVWGRKLHPALHGLLWLIVLARFVLPAAPSSNLSLQSLTAQLSWWSWAGDETLAETTLQPLSDSTAFYFVQLGTAPLASAADTANPWWSLALLLAAIYLVGVAVAIGLRVRAYRRFTMSCRALPSADARTRSTVWRLCADVAVRRLPDVRVSEIAPAPYIVGLWRPILVLSSRHLVRPDEMEAVVLHEVAHLRRGDMWIRCLQWFAGTLLFFWPVVAWVNRRIDLIREHACDQWALRHGNLTCGDYARCLLRAARPSYTTSWAYQPAAMAANSKTIERRIDMILDSPTGHRQSGLMTLAAGLLLAAWATFALSGAASHADEPTSDEQQTSENTFEFHAPEDHAATLIWVAREGAGEEGEAHAISAKSLFLGVDGSCDVFVHRDCLKKFAADHPNADADRDGTVSHLERSAYLAAMALRAERAVLEQFPDVDRDGNGRLSENEAAMLVQANPIPHPPLLPHAAHERVNVEEAHATFEWVADDGETSTKEVVEEPGVTGHVVFMPVGKHFDANHFEMRGPRPQDWLIENVDYRPSRRAVRRLLPVVESAPLDHFLEHHPEADLDEDGELTREEMQAFSQTQFNGALIELQLGEEGGTWINAPQPISVELQLLEPGEDGEPLPLDVSVDLLDSLHEIHEIHEIHDEDEEDSEDN